jgi:uncharacterized repeat protein (TIGR01451 family)
MTPTPTPTPYLTLVKSADKSTAKPLEILTYTLTFSNQGAGTVVNLTLVDTLPPLTQMTYVAGSASDGGVYDPVANTLTWTIPSLSVGETRQVTYQVEVAFLAANQDLRQLINRADLGYTGGSVSTTHTVNIAASTTIRLSIYNGAGEVIKTVVLFQFNTAIPSFQIEGSPVLLDQDQAVFTYNGMTLGTWDATNVEGDKVTNGTYLVKLQSVDPYGTVTTVTRELVVSITRSTLDVAVYNEAGEVVRSFSREEIVQMVAGTGGTLLPEDLDVGRASLSGQVLAVSEAGPGASVTVTLGSGRGLAWDGRGDNGSLVGSGKYFVVVKSSVPGDYDQQMILNLTVQNDGTSGIAGVTVSPNPLRLDQSQQVQFQVNSASGAVTRVEIKIYTVAGELMTALRSDPANPSTVVWDLSGKRVSSGTYLAVVESYGPGTFLGRKVLKVQVIH